MSLFQIKGLKEDYHSWNDFVMKNSAFYTIGQNPSLVDLISKSFGWYGENCVLYHEGKMIGLMNYIIIKDTLVSIPHFSYGGLIVLDEFDVSVVYKEFFDQKKISRYEVRSFQKTTEHAISDKVMNFIYLYKNVDDQFSNFKSKLRSQIRKGYKNGLMIKIGGTELLNDFYRVYSVNMHSLGSPVLSKRFFENILEYYKNGSVNIFCVYYEDMVIGTSMVLDYMGFSEVCWASTLRSYNKLSSNMLLYWEMIKHSIENGMKIFSFGRGSIGGSTYKFKMQWGTEVKQLYFNCSEKRKINYKKMRLLSNLWSKLPLSFANIFGPMISKRIY